MKKTTRLGRGLNALIPDTVTSETIEGTNLLEIKVASIKANPYQPRQDFDVQALEELKSSIREKGII